ncbi:MAG: SDR family oxidoreductase [Firmicutes bacterium]|nr:SDR family oxidoreductase [Bacillota bacterium]
MKILITGTTQGIGHAIAKKFLSHGHKVIGFDILSPSIKDENFTHHNVDVSEKNQLPSLENIDILINNAGVSNEEDAIKVNLIGYINIAEHYAFEQSIKSVLNINSVATHMGIELPRYCASQGGRYAYTKNLALRLAKNGVTVNGISCGGILTEWNREITDDKNLYKKVKNETLLKKWATAEEVADLAHFLTVTNKSITGQDIIIDNGEMAKFNYINDKKTLEIFHSSIFTKETQ